jgi:hypothetical protein
MITCGKCKQKHETVDEVRACYAGECPNLAAAAAVIKHPVNPVKPKYTLPSDGYYTVVFNDTETRLNELGPCSNRDDRITIRLRTQDKSSTFAPGKQIAAYLAGPDNELDYINFAFTNGDHGEVRAYIWKRFRVHTRLDRALNHLLRNPIDAGEAYALESGRCWRCGQRLTVPASIHRGLGPVCAGRLDDGR